VIGYLLNLRGREKRNAHDKAHILIQTYQIEPIDVIHGTMHTIDFFHPIG